MSEHTLFGNAKIMVISAILIHASQVCMTKESFIV